MPSGVIQGAGAPPGCGKAGSAKGTCAKSGMRLMACSLARERRRRSQLIYDLIARISPFVPPVVNIYVDLGCLAGRPVPGPGVAPLRTPARTHRQRAGMTGV